MLGSTLGVGRAVKRWRGGRWMLTKNDRVRNGVREKRKMSNMFWNGGIVRQKIEEW